MIPRPLQTQHALPRVSQKIMFLNNNQLFLAIDDDFFSNRGKWNIQQEMKTLQSPNIPHKPTISEYARGWTCLWNCHHSVLCWRLEFACTHTIFTERATRGIQLIAEIYPHLINLKSYFMRAVMKLIEHFSVIFRRQKQSKKPHQYLWICLLLLIAFSVAAQKNDQKASF